MRSMQYFTQLSFAAIVALAGSQVAVAITPESGQWYNPAEPGTGVSIDITDNFLFLVAYVYDANGQPTWFTAQDFMSSDRHFSSTLHAFNDGQPFGGPYRIPTLLASAGGPVDIVFDADDETKATITWGGQTKPLQRLDFFRSAYGSVNNIHQSQRMLGEWTLVFDLYDHDHSDSQDSLYPYVGDVLIFDQIDTAAIPDFYDGCRPRHSLLGYCTGSALTAHDASGFYDAGSHDQVWVVRDSPTTFFTYIVTAGLNQFDGIMQIHEQGQFNPGGDFYPVRGFRSASRKFVVDGTGPNGATPTDKSISRTRPTLASQLIKVNNGKLPPGLDAAAVKRQYQIDVTRFALPVRMLEQRLAARLLK